MDNINIKNDSSSNIKCIRGLRNIIKSSVHKNEKKDIEINSNNYLNKINENKKINNNTNIFKSNNYKSDPNIITPVNNNIKNINNHIEEIEIKTDYIKNMIHNSNTTPHTIYKQNKKFNLGAVRLNIKNFILTNRKDISSDYIPYSYKDKFSKTLEHKDSKAFSHSFRNISKYNINELSEENRTFYNKTPKINRYSKKILSIYNSKSKTKMKINTNNINNTHDYSINNQRNSLKKNNFNFLNINNNNYINTNESNNGKKNDVINLTFDTLQNDFLNSIDLNNQKNDQKLINKNLENEIKLRIKENKEIKQNILLILDEISKIKERQEMKIKCENDNQIKNNEKSLKISEIIKKTYDFLNDFNRIINEQNLQIYQEIINNLTIFFNN